MPRRFDTSLMRPPDARAACDDVLLARLRAWCEEGAFPRLVKPLAIARVEPHAGIDGAACEMDGSHALARLSRWSGLAWRLQVLLRDHLPWRAAQAGDPWDCGWWRDDALAAASSFRPRRATLLLVCDPAQSVVDELRATLERASPAYTRPLRVLVVSPRPVPGCPTLPPATDDG